jgi:hypothetical protein
MKNIPDSISKSLLKRKEALEQFITKKEAFSLAKAQITWDIEEARIIWMQTLDQLPNQEFNNKKASDHPMPVKSGNGQVLGIIRTNRTSTYKHSSHDEQQQ